MNKRELNKVFTDKVMEYVNKGFVIRPETTNSCDGTWKIDLENNKKIIRVCMERTFAYGYRFRPVITLSVRSMDRKKLYSADDIPFSSDFFTEIEAPQKFYEMRQSCYYLSEQEYEATKDIIAQKRAKRRTGNKEVIHFDDRAKQIVLSYIKRQPRCKTVKLSDIRYVDKVITRNGSLQCENENIRVSYIVEVDKKRDIYCLSDTRTYLH